MTKPDYRKLYREGAALLLRLYDDPRYLLTDADIALIDRLRAIPKPGGGKPDRRSPGSGRKKAAVAK